MQSNPAPAASNTRSDTRITRCGIIISLVLHCPTVAVLIPAFCFVIECIILMLWHLYSTFIRFYFIIFFFSFTFSNFTIQSITLETKKTPIHIFKFIISINIKNFLYIHRIKIFFITLLLFAFCFSVHDKFRSNGTNPNSNSNSLD